MSFNPLPIPFERRFGETHGYVAGRTAERAVGEAQALSLKSANGSRVRQLASLIAQELILIPQGEVSVYEARLKGELGVVWTKLPRSVQVLLAQSEYLMALPHPKDFDWSPAAMQYSRAFEETLRRTLGVRVDSFLVAEGRLGKIFADECIPKYRGEDPKAARLILEDFGRLLKRAANQPLFSKFLNACIRQ